MEEKGMTDSVSVTKYDKNAFGATCPETIGRIFTMSASNFLHIKEWD